VVFSENIVGPFSFIMLCGQQIDHGLKYVLSPIVQLRGGCPIEEYPIFEIMHGRLIHPYRASLPELTKPTPIYVISVYIAGEESPLSNPSPPTKELPGLFPISWLLTPWDDGVSNPKSDGDLHLQSRW
jgi:hypothetical protein